VANLIPLVVHLHKCTLFPCYEKGVISTSGGIFNVGVWNGETL